MLVQNCLLTGKRTFLNGRPPLDLPGSGYRFILFYISDCLADLRSGGPNVILESFDCFFSVLRSVLNSKII